MNRPDVDARQIMLDRHKIWPDDFDQKMGARLVWNVAYRSWRANRRSHAFPTMTFEARLSGPCRCKVDCFE